MAHINANASAIKLAIQHQVTEDLPDGQPWPPDGADLWCIVKRSHGFTQWRRVFLETTTTQRSGVVTLDGGLHAISVVESEMANARKYAGSSYLKLGDLHGNPPLRETISYVAEETGKYGEKLVLFFESGNKLSLNRTSVGNLVRDIGPDSDDWAGHEVEVFAGEVDFQHGKADAVLVRLIATDTPPGAKKARGDMDDEIPW